MKITSIAAVLIASLSSVKSDGEVVTVHGSGTTNPSKCIWHIMSLFEERSQIMTRLTYRAVGSSTGQAEFLGKDKETGFISAITYNDFGAGDIPIKQSDWELFNGATSANNIVHLPFAMSSVSFFHNIPGVPDGEEGIKLDGCQLARIFDGKIRRWDDSEIMENQNEKVKAALRKVKGDIFVGRRVEGSSSTKGITQYLHATCPGEWPEDRVQSQLTDWHVSTNPCQGSGGMTNCVRENPGSIGYMDSGHGWSEEIAEVNVRNKRGTYITSKESHAREGIAAAASAAGTPTSADADWSDVEFLLKDGADTWPITVMSYVYLRKDLELIVADVMERGLLKLFLESLYDENYFGNCEKLGFSAPPASVIDIAKAGIEMINWNFGCEHGQPAAECLQSGGINMWTKETADTTEAIRGMGKFVISGKRRSLAGVSIEDIAGAEKQLKATVDNLNNVISTVFGNDEEELVYVFESMDKVERDVDAALVLGALSFTLWACVIVGFIIKRFIFRK